MKNILVLEGGDYVGGGQIMTLNISKILSVYYKIFIALPEQNNELIKLLNNNNLIKYNSRKKNDGRKTLLDLINYMIEIVCIIPKISKTIKKNNIDLLYIQSQKIVPIGVIAGILTKRPVLVHLHVVHIDKKSKFVLNCFLKSKCVKKIIGVSNYTLSQLDPINKLKSKVIYNFIDLHRKCSNTNEYKYIDDSIFNIAVIANIINDKGQDIVIDALKYLKENNVKLYIIGSIRDRIFYNKLIKIIEDNNLEKYVVFTGKVENILGILKKINLVIVPSKSNFETFSLSMVEAWSEGIPTIASNLGGMKELVEEFLPEYKEMMLFEKGNSKELAEKCLFYVKNKQLESGIYRKIRYISNIIFSKEKFKEEINNCIKEINNNIKIRS